MTDLVPMTEMKVTDHYHIKLCFEYVGAHMVLDKLEALSKTFPKLPGVALACESAKAEVNDIRVRMLTRNVTVAIKHGFDPEGQSLAMEVRTDGLYLKAVALPEDEA